jgi:hypothetical protein
LLEIGIQHTGLVTVHQVLEGVEHRRSRILRPGEINVVVSDFKVKLRSDTRASVDFVQAYSSPGYRDRVVKRLDLERAGAHWKIVSERTLSVL